MTTTLSDVDLAFVAGGLGQLLHAAGVPVTPERGGRFAAAIALASPSSTDELYWLARVTLVADQSQLDTFDRVFTQLFGGILDNADERGDPNAPPAVQATRAHQASVKAGHSQTPGQTPSSLSTRDDASDDLGSDESMIAAWSAEERLRSKDFDALTVDELLTLRVLMRDLALASPLRRSRREVRHPLGKTLDRRATLRRARRTGGDPVDRVLRRRRTKPRRVVFICDISGSMEAYARAYLQLLHCAAGGARAETFVFATQLTRLTKQLRTRSPDQALARAGHTAPDWSGGTRIGAALKTFNDSFGRRGLARGAIVVIVSDGWERDNPALLRGEMERLGRLAHRVIWVNPRRANPAYEPLVGGMVAALPFIDEFVSGHSLEAMRELIETIALGEPAAAGSRSVNWPRSRV